MQTRWIIVTRLSFVALAVFLATACPAAAGQLFAGSGQEDISPPSGFPHMKEIHFDRILSPLHARALVLSRAVREIEALVATGERGASILLDAARGFFAGVPEVRIDYIALVDWGTLLPVEVAAPGTLFAVAAYVGATRLIDNMVSS